MPATSTSSRPAAATAPTSSAEAARTQPGGRCRCGEPHDLDALRAAGAVIGQRVRIDPSATIDGPDGLMIGDDVEIGPGVRVFADGGVTLGDRVIVGPGAQILSSEPRVPTGNRPIFGAGRRCVPIAVFEDAYIGPGAILNPGATVAQAAYVLPGSVVSHYVSHCSLVRGNPAAAFRTRNSF